MVGSYYTELGSPERVLYFKSHRKELTIKTDNPKTAAILLFTFLLAAFEGYLFCCAWLGIRIFDCAHYTCLVSSNISLTKLTICAYSFHYTLYI